MILISWQCPYPIEYVVVFLQDILFNDGQDVTLPIYECCTIKQLYRWAFQILPPSTNLLVPLCFATMAFQVCVLDDCLSFDGVILGNESVVPSHNKE